MINLIALLLAASAEAGVVCEKACIAPHDAKVIACKASKAGAEETECLADAKASRTKCELKCKAKAAKSKARKAKDDVDGDDLGDEVKDKTEDVGDKLENRGPVDRLEDKVDDRD